VDHISVADLTNQGVDEAVSYMKRNAFELVVLGHAVFARRCAHFSFIHDANDCGLHHAHAGSDRRLLSFAPAAARAHRLRSLLARLDRGLSGVVRGQLLICGVNGVLSAIGFALFGLKYWPILAIVGRS